MAILAQPSAPKGGRITSKYFLCCVSFQIKSANATWAENVPHNASFQFSSTQFVSNFRLAGPIGSEGKFEVVVMDETPIRESGFPLLYMSINFRLRACLPGFEEGKKVRACLFV